MEPLETRRMLACRALPFNFSGSTFDQCFTQNFVDDGTTYDVTTYYSEGTGTDDLTDDGVDGIHANAQAMADETEDAFQFFLDRGFDVLPAAASIPSLTTSQFDIDGVSFDGQSRGEPVDHGQQGFAMGFTSRPVA